MPIFLATMPAEGATVVDGFNAALVYAEDTTLARAALNAAYPGGSTAPWNGANFLEVSQANLPYPIFLAAPKPVNAGSQSSTES